ncbi:Fc.00g050220.m01.CDS01 [Cosmosporella sp. VM-42]
MPENSNSESLNALDPEEQNSLRALSRSPHPYHHQNFELPHASDRFVLRNGTAHPKPDDNGIDQVSATAYPAFPKDSPQTSDSGSEADDEHFLKGLPAPKARLHKGLRGRNEPLSGSSTPLPSPAILEEEGRRSLDKPFPAEAFSDSRLVLDVVRRKRILVRRATEAGIILALGVMVASNRQVSRVLDIWGKDIKLLILSYAGLLALYPLRVVVWAYRNSSSPSHRIPLEIPSHFDPAPLLYPQAITLFVSLLVCTDNPAGVLPNLILSTSTIPQRLIPKVDPYATYDTVSWVLACLPLIWSSKTRASTFDGTGSSISDETATLLYPLHQTLCLVLHHLTTTSLLTAELQLLSVALINILLLAFSPQIQILKAVIWGGGLSVLVLCGPVIRWGIALARVPKWRFRRVSGSQSRPLMKSIAHFFSWRRLKNEVLSSNFEDTVHESAGASSDDDTPLLFKRPVRVRTMAPGAEMSLGGDSVPSSPNADGFANGSPFARRHTLPYIDNVIRRNVTHTPSGRRKRATSMSVRPFFKLTQAQATLRKWLYASYVYACVFATVLLGVRTHVEKYALAGNEPIGWALGYLFGDLPWFRFEVVHANLERWVCLPPRSGAIQEKECSLGWVQHIRHDDFGEANTRLLLSAYWLVILIVGLAIVFRLKNIYEVDTRRKVFHFMMVGMFLPSIFVDPTYAALALSLILGIFLMLDLLRASQLPPLSKPIASFLAPYVDGRDFRGPVVISHIFLLIGCAIPLWLALASLPRTGTSYLVGWEIPTREVSMVSGVLCVGLGDAAASLIGRRWGHRKWLWGGGKSLEGSVAFAAIVFIGLAAAHIWLRIGGWRPTYEQTSVLASARNAGMCSAMASLTEAVLTGGNDNVIVPVILWTCVKSLGI